MVARLFFSVLAAAIGTVSPPLSLPLSAAQTGSPGGAGVVVVMKRAQFRPVVYQLDAPPLRNSGQSSVSRQPAHSFRSGSREADLFDNRAGARKAVPIARGQELGLQFRPDDRATSYGQVGGSSSQSGVGSTSTQDQSSFRPLQPRRKPSYEEMESQRHSRQSFTAPRAALPYPPMPTMPLQLPPMVPPAWPTY